MDRARSAFLKRHPYALVGEQDIEGTFVLRFIERRKPPPSLSAIIGDCVHNWRAALDHLAYSLAGASADDRTEFPIFRDPDRFHAVDGKGRPKRGSGLSKMHDMPAAAQEIIERLQPYHGRNGLPEIEPLWLLQCLDIEDKHHAFNLVGGAFQADWAIAFRGGGGLSGTTGDFLTFEHGAEVFRSPAPPAGVDDNSRYTFDVAFDPQGPGRGIPVTKCLGDIREAVVEAIDLLEPFL